MSQSPPPIKGRGSAAAPEGRYIVTRHEAEDDGWFVDGEPASPPRTTVTEERARSIISRNTSPDISFSQSINPYRGCEHGCSYCFARPSHSFLELSPGLDFETKLFAKVNAAELLREELAKKSYVCSPITIGVNTDCYQPIERKYQLTRRVIEVLAETCHPFSIITKNALVARDLDLTPSALRGWVERARADRGAAKPGVLNTDERSELAALRKEVRQLRTEKEILKKAAAFFAKETT